MDYKIKIILDNFDFQKVHIAMQKLNWRWDFNNKLPSIVMLKHLAEQLLLEVNKIALEKALNYCEYSSGGFYATYFNGDLNLKFAIESFSNIEYEE